VSQAFSQMIMIFPAGLILGSIVALAAPLAWLAGLALALRGSKPTERASILRAYASCHLPLASLWRSPPNPTRKTPAPKP
jgi:hypothetical protein